MYKLVLAIGLGGLLLCCTQRQQRLAKASETELQRQWMLTELGSIPRDTLLNYRVQIDIKSKEEVGLYAGCNQLSSGLKLSKKDGLRFIDLTSTLMACPDVSGQLEDALTKAVLETDRYEVNGHQLTLYKGSGRLIRAIAADWD